MFGLSIIQERLAGLGVIVLIAIGLVLYGEHRVKEHDRLAVAARQEAIKEQKAADKKSADEVINGLKTDLAALLGTPANGPPPRVQLCNRPSAVRSAGAIAQGAATQSPLSSDVQQLPERTPERPDIGPGLQDLALACGIVEVYRQRTVEWAIKQAIKVPGT